MIEQVTEVNSTLLSSSHSIFIICTLPYLTDGPGRKIARMAQLLVMMVELTSETWCELVNSQATHHVVLYRIKIRNDLT